MLALDPTRPLALLADFRANLAATDAVLAEVDRRGIDQGIILGELLSHGPDPDLVADRARTRAGQGWVVLCGALSLAMLDPVSGWNVSASRAAAWCRGRLDPGWNPWSPRRPRWDWLRALPDHHRDGELFAVCGSPDQKGPFFTPAFRPSPTTADDFTGATALTITAVGRPGAVRPGQCWTTAAQRGHSLVLVTTPTVLCPGAVGQPRDEDPRAAWAVVEAGWQRVTWHRTVYDIEATIARLAAIPALDSRNGERLRQGR